VFVVPFNRRGGAHTNNDVVTVSVRTTTTVSLLARLLALLGVSIVMATTTVTGHESQLWRAGIEKAGWTHLNAAGASPMPASTHDAVLKHLELECSIGGYAAAAASDGRASARRSVALLLGASEDEIALHESAQAAWARAFSCLRFEPTDRILCFESEYAGNACAYLQAARYTGVTIDVLPMRDDGVVDIKALQKKLEERSEQGSEGAPAPGRDVVALTHVQTDSSVVQPAAEVGALCRQHGAVYLLDACQSVGQLPVDARQLDCDFLCGTGRKWLRGPRGTGFLYARRDALESSPRRPAKRSRGDEPPPSSPCPPLRRSESLIGEPGLVDHVSVRWLSRDSYEMAAGAKRFEMWEGNEAGHAGLAAAADLCKAIGPERIHSLSTELARRLRASLLTINGVTLRDAPAAFDDAKASADGASRCAIVCFEAESLRGIPSATLRDELASRRIGVSVSPGTHTFDDTQWSRPPAVRASPSYFNTAAEVDALVIAVREILDSRG
jgi:cysteine desulfurase/selenocysteine lyase